MVDPLYDKVKIISVSSEENLEPKMGHELI